MIQRALVRRGNSGAYHFEEPKTPKSRRTIPLPASLVGALSAHRHTQLAARLKLGAVWTDLDLIFCSEIGTPLDPHNIASRHFKPALKRAGLPDMRLYDLRHTCATLLLSAGENPKVVAERLGHSTIILTLDTYTHVLPDMQQAASDKLEKMLFAG